MKTNAQAIAESELEKHALKLSDAGQHAVLRFLDENLQVRRDDRGLSVMVVAEDGGEITPDAFFADWTARYPGYFATTNAATPAPAPQPATLTGRMVATIAADRSNDNKAARAAEIASAGNPWRQSTWNLTRQGLVANLDADLAGRLRRDAGVSA